MKNAAVTISYDEEKLAALRLYMEQKNLSVETELTQALENLYTKNVPANVRDFIDLRGSQTKQSKSKKSKTERIELPSDTAEEVCESADG